MKKSIFLLLVLIPCLAFSQKAKIEFENLSFDFGTISEKGGQATTEFKFKNTGTTPLILTNVRAGCGCTTPEWDRQPVAPGASGKITVAYNPLNRPGSFIKTVTVNSNAENPVVTLTIRGNVSRKPLDPLEEYKFAVGQVRMLSNNVNLGILTNKQETEKSIEIINTEDKPADITVSSPSKHIIVTVAPKTLTKKGEKGTIHLKYLAGQKNDWGFVNDNINITVNNTEKGNLSVTANIEEDFSGYNAATLANAPVALFSEKECTLDNAAKNSTLTHEFYIENAGKEDLFIRKLKPSDESVSVSTSKSVVKPGKKVKVSLSYKTDANAGKKIKIVQFTVNDPKNPVITYKINANVI